MYESVLTGDYIMACLWSNVNSDQWNGGDRPSAIAIEIRPRLVYIPDGRESRRNKIVRSMIDRKCITRGSRLMALLIIYVDRSHLWAKRRLNVTRDCSIFFLLIPLSLFFCRRYHRCELACDGCESPYGFSEGSTPHVQCFVELWDVILRSCTFA